MEVFRWKRVVLGLDTKRFHKDLRQIDRGIKNLMQLDIIHKDDIDLILGRIWDTVPKYITIKTS